MLYAILSESHILLNSPPVFVYFIPIVSIIGNTCFPILKVFYINIPTADDFSRVFVNKAPVIRRFIRTIFARIIGLDSRLKLAGSNDYSGKTEEISEL